jgi:hypothetical protein
MPLLGRRASTSPGGADTPSKPFVSYPTRSILEACTKVVARSCTLLSQTVHETTCLQSLQAFCVICTVRLCCLLTQVCQPSCLCCCQGALGSPEQGVPAYVEGSWSHKSTRVDDMHVVLESMLNNKRWQHCIHGDAALLCHYLSAALLYEKGCVARRTAGRTVLEKLRSHPDLHGPDLLAHQEGAGRCQPVHLQVACCNQGRGCQEVTETLVC